MPYYSSLIIGAEVSIQCCLQLKKSTRRFLREKPSGSDEPNGDGSVSDAQAVNSMESKPVVTVDKIGDLTPIQDFEAMMSRRDSPDWVDKAIEDMKNKIFGLLENSDEGINYPKAVELLVALRKGCILEQVYLSVSFFLLWFAFAFWDNSCLNDMSSIVTFSYAS